MNRLACALVLTGSALLAAAIPAPAWAAPSPSQGSLQLSIISPDAGSIADRVALDVSFRGGTVERVELYLDGNLAAQRQLSTSLSRGVITFSLDAVQLTEGNHDVLVKAFGPEGKPAIATTRIKIPGADLASPVRISHPLNGLVVSGVIPIRVTLTSDLQREKPYVSFFVDKEFKSLKNFPPYDYNWDTTKVPNGWHVLEAMTATPDAATPTKARSIHVNVNNPGGQTAKLNAIEDLNPKSKSAQVSGHPADLTSLAPSAKSDTGTGAAITSSRSPILQIVIPNGVAVPKTAKHPIGFTNAKSSEPSIYNGGGVAAASGTIPVSVNSGRISGPGPKRMGSAIQEPKGRMPKLAGRKATLPLVSDSGVVVPVIPPTNEVGGSLTRFEPGTTLESIARRTGHSADELRSLNGLKKGQALPKVGAIIVPRAGTFDVAFDGNQIAFDVPPRVEGGIKLAPFRQIFEHSGGRLYWFNSVKTVRAVNSSREIELKIGNPNALVNNQTMTMERKPFIETGRTIVPLTFIRDALNVNISYDEKSGRLLIESNK